MEVFVHKIGRDAQTGKAIVILAEPVQEKLLPILVGPTEANAITFAWNEVKHERPLTHNLLFNMLDTLNYEVEKVEIDHLREGAYKAQVYLLEKGQRHACATKELSMALGRRSIDSRPSDAIALALLSKAPLYVERSVLEQWGLPAKAVAFEQETAPALPAVDPDFLQFLAGVKASDFTARGADGSI